MKNTIKLIEAMRSIAVIVLITTAIIPMLACGYSSKASTTKTAPATAAPVIAAEPSTLIITGLETYNGSDLPPYDPDA